jgi:hypothetical protein
MERLDAAQPGTLIDIDSPSREIAEWRNRQITRSPDHQIP